MNINSILFGILSTLLILVTGDENLTCYSCNSNTGLADDTCLTNPGAVEVGQPIVPCANGYCVVQRIVNKGEPDGFWSFYRGCNKNKPDHTDEVVEEATRISYHQCCRTPICNVGNGYEHLGKQCSSELPGSSAVSQLVNFSAFGVSILAAFLAIR